MEKGFWEHEELVGDLDECECGGLWKVWHLWQFVSSMKEWANN